MTKRMRVIAIISLVVVVGVFVWIRSEVIGYQNTMRHINEEMLGLKVVIGDENAIPLYVVLCAWNTNGQLMGEQAYGYSRGYMVNASPSDTRNRRNYLYCGPEPDYEALVLQICIWELPKLPSGPSDLHKMTSGNPIYHAIVRRPDFIVPDRDDHQYVPFAVISRTKGGTFRLMASDWPPPRSEVKSGDK